MKYFWGTRCFEETEIKVLSVIRSWSIREENEHYPECCIWLVFVTKKTQHSLSHNYLLSPRWDVFNNKKNQQIKTDKQKEPPTSTKNRYILELTIYFSWINHSEWQRLNNVLIIFSDFIMILYWPYTISKRISTALQKLFNFSKNNQSSVKFSSGISSFTDRNFSLHAYFKAFVHLFLFFFFSFFPIFPCAVQNAFYQPSSLSCQSLLSRQAYKTMSGNDHKSFLTFWIIFLNHLDHLHFVQKLHFYLPVVNVLIPFYIGWLSDNLLLYPCTPPLDWSVFISKISPNASYRWKYYHFQMKPWDRYRFSLLLKQRKHRNVKKTVRTKQ